jgi:hypothetical protein
MRTKNHAYKKQNGAYKTHGSKRCVLSKRCVFLVPAGGGWAQEVDHGGAGAHLLLVVTKFSAVVALQGVATTYHGALKV